MKRLEPDQEKMLRAENDEDKVVKRGRKEGELNQVVASVSAQLRHRSEMGARMENALPLSDVPQKDKDEEFDFADLKELEPLKWSPTRAAAVCSESEEVVYPELDPRVHVQKGVIGILVHKSGQTAFKKFSSFCLIPVAQAGGVYFAKVKSALASANGKQVVLTAEQLQKPTTTVNALVKQGAAGCSFSGDGPIWKEYCSLLYDKFSKVPQWQYHEKLGLITPQLFAWSNSVQWVQSDDGTWQKTNAWSTKRAVPEMIDFGIVEYPEVQEALDSLNSLRELLKDGNDLETFFWLVVYVAASLNASARHSFFHLWFHGISDQGKTTYIQSALSVLIPNEILEGSILYKEHATQQDAETVLGMINGIVLILDEADQLQGRNLAASLKKWANTSKAGVVLAFNDEQAPDTTYEGLRKRYIDIVFKLKATLLVSRKEQCSKAAKSVFGVFPLLLQHCICDNESLQATEEKYADQLPPSCREAGLIMLHVGLQVGKYLFRESDEYVLHQFRFLVQAQDVVDGENVKWQKKFCSLLQEAASKGVFAKNNASCTTKNGEKVVGIKFLVEPFWAFCRKNGVDQGPMERAMLGLQAEFDKTKGGPKINGKDRCELVPYSVIERFLGKSAKPSQKRRSVKKKVITKKKKNPA